MVIVVGIKDAGPHSMRVLEEALRLHLLEHGLAETDEVTVTIAPVVKTRVAVAGASSEMDTLGLAYEAAGYINARLSAAPLNAKKGGAGG